MMKQETTNKAPGEVFLLALLLHIVLMSYYYWVSRDNFLNPPENKFSYYLLIGGTSLVRAMFWATLLYLGLWLTDTLPRLQKALKWLSVGLLSLSFIVEFTLVSQQGTLFSSSIAKIIANSNPSESSEFLTSTLSLMDLLCPLLAIALLFGLVKFLHTYIHTAHPYSSVSLPIWYA